MKLVKDSSSDNDDDNQKLEQDEPEAEDINDIVAIHEQEYPVDPVNSMTRIYADDNFIQVRK